jgi:kynureninase
VYFCGNSLGLQPRAVREAVNAELDYWGELGVEGHFKGRLPWMDYHEFVRDDLAEVVGAQPIRSRGDEHAGREPAPDDGELLSPDAERHAILIEAGAFPTDRYAVESQIRFHGFDPATVADRTGSRRTERHHFDGGDRTRAGRTRLAHRAGDAARRAIPHRPGIRPQGITELAHKHGCVVGFDLAHAVGNLPLQLHDSGADFAIWCSYKYLNGGPGAVGGASCTSVMPRRAAALRRLVGPRQDHALPDGPEFVPTPGADGWQLSNPPILALAPLRVSLEIFRRAGMQRLREKSLQLTGYLEWLVQTQLPTCWKS